MARTSVDMWGSGSKNDGTTTPDTRSLMGRSDDHQEKPQQANIAIKDSIITSFVIRVLPIALFGLILLGSPAVSAKMVAVTFNATVTSLTSTAGSPRFAGIDVGDSFEGALWFNEGCGRFNLASWCSDDVSGHFQKFGPLVPQGKRWGPFEIDFWNNHPMRDQMGQMRDGINLHEFFWDGDHEWQILGWTPVLAAMSCANIACVEDVGLWPRNAPLTFSIGNQLEAAITRVTQVPLPSSLWTVAVGLAGLSAAGFTRARRAD